MSKNRLSRILITTMLVIAENSGAEVGVRKEVVVVVGSPGHLILFFISAIFCLISAMRLVVAASAGTFNRSNSRICLSHSWILAHTVLFTRDSSVFPSSALI